MTSNKSSRPSAFRFLLSAFSLLLFFFVPFSATAQDSPISGALKKQLLLYLNRCNEEKIYVQTDKTFYKQGENIYFNLFLTDASTGKPSLISDKVYVIT